MPIAITGTGTITGLSAGGLPDGCITTAELAQPFTLATAQASTSGTAIDFTGIPSWVKRLTVMFNGVSTNGSSATIVQLGTSSGFVATGYLGSAGWGINAAGVAASNNSTGFLTDSFGGAANTRHGNATICTIGSNIWSFNSIIGLSDAAGVGYAGGSIPLGGVLDRIRITSTGADTFDAGAINIIYEG